MFGISVPDQWNRDDPRFMAFYCHYEADAIFTLELGRQPDEHLMLTPTMNGCSFGVGAESGPGVRLVAHANVSRTSSDAEGIEKQGEAQAEKIRQKIAEPVIFGPDKYVETDIEGTVVGVRKDNHWSFFMPTWTRTGTTYKRRRIIDINT